MNQTSPTTIEIITQSRRQTEAVGQAVASLAEPGEVIALEGALGAGKTQFVRGLARGLEADERLVSSPTFVLMQEYQGRRTLIHIDAYRINDLSDLESMGWADEMLEEAVVAVEWADRIAEQLPQHRLEVQLDHLPAEDHRRIRLTPAGAWTDRLDALEAAVSQALSE